MKKMIRKTTAAALAAVLTCSALPVNAGYQSTDEIAFALRGMESENCGYIADGNTVYLSTAAAKAGKSVHMGMFIEAEYADMAFIYVKFLSDSSNVTFNEETYHNPTGYYTEEKVTYTMEDGTQFSTRLKPYCFGEVNSNDVYVTNSFGVTHNFNPEENSLYLTWMYSYSGAMAGLEQYSPDFFGSRSDEFSFVEVDMDVAAAASAGTYTVSFDTSLDQNGDSLTRLTSDDTELGEDYNDFIPELKELEIVVLEGGDANRDGKTDAADAAAVLMYSASRGAGEEAALYSAENAEEERIAYYLADVDENSIVCGDGDGTALDAKDASAILQYAAIDGSGITPDWSEILSQ